MDYFPSPLCTCPTLNALAMQMIRESLLESSLNLKLPSSSWAQCRDRVFSSHTMNSTVYCALPTLKTRVAPGRLRAATLVRCKAVVRPS